MCPSRLLLSHLHATATPSASHHPFRFPSICISTQFASPWSRVRLSLRSPTCAERMACSSTTFSCHLRAICILSVLLCFLSVARPRMEVLKFNPRCHGTRENEHGARVVWCEGGYIARLRSRMALGFLLSRLPRTNSATNPYDSAQNTLDLHEPCIVVPDLV
ncbi:hypothetical protein BKA62DRAFT_10163 [Auriculariales sp. MPI-PUGE-AT-0066]|nr:hypothetical protein BKA62DRAFT_10163 [Auriculariales sp. MPI-PUGE-AT-0066]